VQSDVGRGTTFKIYVPRAHEEGARAARGGETILLVEDDDHVREFATRALEKRGYRVLGARYGDEAIAIARDLEEPIELLLSDVLMPQMGGGDTARAIREVRPNIKVLYMSAYPDALITLEAELGQGAVLLPKPFSPDDLERRVRELLDDHVPALATT
jgi:DNA-binding response OmpR family regulator